MSKKQSIYITKRDGSKAKYDKKRIKRAITNSFVDVDKVLTDESKSLIKLIVKKVDKRIVKDYSIGKVENIQDLIESQLMLSDRKDIAKAYILYRNERTKIREGNSSLIKKVKERLSGTNIENANANVDENSFSGREKEASSDLQKFMAIELEGLSKDVTIAHREMLIYQHDLDKALIGMHNCLNIDLTELFTHGFRTRNGDVRPPSSFSTACQLVAVAFQCQSQVQ